MVDMKKTRLGFGHGLVEAGEKNPHVVVLVGDLRDSTSVNFFAERFPERFIEVGIAEQNMANVAAGLSLTGCASTGNKAEPQMMTGADQQPHPRHDSSIDSHVHKE